MKIKQVEELVGITQKNIRFYEDEGLLLVERAQNGYREYNLNDVKRLKEIKMLRLISVPIDNIRQLFDGKKNLDEVLDEQVCFLQNQRDSMDKMCMFCKSLADKDLNMDSLNVDECLEKIEALEKEGIKFMDIANTDVHFKKKMGAFLSALVVIAIMVAAIALIIDASLQEPLPIIAVVLLTGIPVLVIICLIVAFIQRNREIEGGEEDEASKY